MKLQTYTFTFGQTVNTGNYNSKRFEITATVAIDKPLEDCAEDIAELENYVRAKVAVIHDRIKSSAN